MRDDEPRWYPGESDREHPRSGSQIGQWGAPEAASTTPTQPLSSAAARLPQPMIVDSQPDDDPPRRPSISRRLVLATAAAGTVALGAGAGLGLWFTRQHAATPAGDPSVQLAHLLRRAGFGMRPSEAAEYAGLGLSGAIDRLLDPSRVADTLDSQLAPLRLNLSSITDIQRWFLLRMIYSRRPLEEKMTLFWHGLLTSSYQKIGGTKGYPLLVQQNKLLRAHALGRFDDLIRAISTDPAMMYWLDLRTSTAKSPNENYARELMELFTLGIGNYSQDDVVAGARALTGWVIRGNAGVFVPGRHAGGSTSFLGQTGALGLDDIVRIVCAHPATAHHLAWRLWTFFAYENPSDADLKPLVDAYTTQQHSIAAVMRALLTSPAFASDRAYRARIKSPVEFVTGAIRALDLRTSATGLPQILRLMGQTLFAPPNVSGWDGDKLSTVWITTQSWMTRVNFVNELLAIVYGTPNAPGAHVSAADTSSLTAAIAARQIRSPQALVSYFVETLLDNQLSADRVTIVTDFLHATAAQTPDGPAIPLYGGAAVPSAAVRGALYLLMGMPEYQLN